MIRSLFVPALPPMLNSRGNKHWSATHAARIAFRDVFALVVAQHRPAPVVGLAASVIIVTVWPDRRRRDLDNAAKTVLDNLVRCGLIMDDGPPWLTTLTLGWSVNPAAAGVSIAYQDDGAPLWLPERRRPRVQGQGGPRSSIVGHPRRSKPAARSTT